jgi:hypothetical protein
MRSTLLRALALLLPRGSSSYRGVVASISAWFVAVCPTGLMAGMSPCVQGQQQ